jgi:uncharacterized membrane protein YkvA (DUF1232 family)
MPTWALAALVVTGAYAGLVLALVVAGRRSDAKALVRFVPDCVVLFRRLSTDERVPRPHRWAAVAVLAYLVLPFDLVPDFVPVAGQLDDVVVVALVLRAVIRGAGADVVAELWPGPQQTLNAVLRAAGSRASTLADAR